TGRAVTWSSSNIAVATISASGAITAVTAGTTTITASIGGVNGTAGLTVQASVAAVSVALAQNPLSVAQTTAATATLRDASGNTLTGRAITWSSANNAVATVNSNGVV